MNELIDDAIRVLCNKIKSDNDGMFNDESRGLPPDSALKYTQAAVNLANTKRALLDCDWTANRLPPKD